MKEFLNQQISTHMSYWYIYYVWEAGTNSVQA